MYTLTDKQNAIREVQRFLLEISYATDGIPHLSIDGIYGPQTVNAVSIFQQRNGLPTSGEADPDTWAELFRQYESARAARIELPSLLPPNKLPLSLHARGSEVMLLQVLLDAMRDTVGHIPSVSINGHFDPETQRALRAYQTHRHLPASGILDADTWRFLTRDYQTARNRTRHAE